MNKPRTPEFQRFLSATMATLLFLGGAAVLPRLAHSQPTQSTQPTPKMSPTRFAKDIDAYLAADRTNPPPKQGILFIGSSIFRQWEKLPEQMAPLPVFNRAFGGSLTTDVLYYMDQVVLPYEPRAIVYYCGSNDINEGRDAAKVFDGFRLFVERVHEKLPNTRLFYVSINRSPQKRSKWGIVDAANKRAREYCTKDKSLSFIDVNPTLFDKNGQPREELYQPDRLHFKPPAYDGFTAIIKPILTRSWAEITANDTRK